MVGIPFRFDGILDFNTIKTTNYNNTYWTHNTRHFKCLWSMYVTFMKITLTFELNTVITLI